MCGFGSHLAVTRDVAVELERIRIDVAFAGRLLDAARADDTAATASELTSAVTAFVTAYPNVRVDLDGRPSRQIVGAVVDSRAELGIVADSVDLGGLETCTLRPDPLGRRRSGSADWHPYDDARAPVPALRRVLRLRGSHPAVPDADVNAGDQPTHAPLVAVAVGAASVRVDQQPRRGRVVEVAARPPLRGRSARRSRRTPARDRLDREHGSVMVDVMVDPDVDPPPVLRARSCGA
jgi:hypothetical protein